MKLPKDMERLDGVFSQYVRMLRSDADGCCECCTCGERQPWREMRVVHYAPIERFATRYNERNVHPQCARCARRDTRERLRQFMIRTYSIDSMHRLSAASKKQKRYTEREVQLMIDEYLEQIRRLAQLRLLHEAQLERETVCG